MKKITILLCAALLVALSACGGEDGNSSGSSEKSSGNPSSQSFLNDSSQETSSNTNFQIFESITPEGEASEPTPLSYREFAVPELPPSDEERIINMYYAGGEPYDILLAAGYRRSAADQFYYRSEYYGVKNGVPSLLFSWDNSKEGYVSMYECEPAINSVGFGFGDKYMRARFFRYATGKLEDSVGVLASSGFILADQKLIVGGYPELMQVNLATNARSILSRNANGDAFLGTENEIIYLETDGEQSQIVIQNLDNGEGSAFPVPEGRYYLDCNADYALAWSRESEGKTYLYNRKMGESYQLDLPGSLFLMPNDNKLLCSEDSRDYCYDIETNQLSRISGLEEVRLSFQKQSNHLVGYTYNYKTGGKDRLFVFE